MKLNLSRDSEAKFGQDFEAQVLWRGWCLVEILKMMLGRDSEDELWSRFVFELVIRTQPSGPLCLWQCFLLTLVLFGSLSQALFLIGPLRRSGTYYYSQFIWVPHCFPFQVVPALNFAGAVHTFQMSVGWKVNIRKSNINPANGNRKKFINPQRAESALCEQSSKPIFKIQTGRGRGAMAYDPRL